MQIIFKNSTGSNKGKQCEQFLSILKKLKFQLSSKDKMLHFYVDKERKKFIMTTFSNRNLEDPPAGSPSVFIDYEFGQDMYNLSNYALNKSSMFGFGIEDIVKLINHYYETKMSVLSIEIDSDLSNGMVEFEVPEQVEGGVPLVVQPLTFFPATKPYAETDHIDYFLLFELNEEYFEKLKEIEDIKYTCCYEIHQEGIYLKNYSSKIEDNKCLLSEKDLFKYDSVTVKEKLKGLVYIQEPENHLIEEIKIGVKKHYKKLQARMILVRRPTDPETVRSSYIEIEAQLSLFPKTVKRIICKCEISSEINTEGVIAQDIPLNIGTDLLKNEEPLINGLRRIVVNRWAGRAGEYLEEKAGLQREREVHLEIKELQQQTKTRKIRFKLEERD